MSDFINKPRKSLGQNFLVDQNIANKIIQACKLQKSDRVLEIGPGLGQLTKAIAPEVKEVLGIELDRHLCENLEKNLKFDNIRLSCQDILQFDFRKLAFFKVKVIGNLPYYISTPIISHLLEHKDKITAIYIALQKELGERVVASPGGKEYGAFTCFVQYHTQPKILFNIKRGCFRPQPKVDSVFLELKIRENPAVAVEDEDLFFKIIRQAFNQRRKTIINGLAGLFPKSDSKSILEKARINPQLRPEQLSLEDFAKITHSAPRMS